MNVKDTFKKYISYLKWSNLKKVPLSYKSKEYQRMLCGTRLFFGLFAHKRNINVILFGVIGFAIINIAMWISFIRDIETLSKIFFFISYMTILLILLLVFVISNVIRELHKFRLLKGLIIFYREKLSGLVLLFLIFGLFLVLITDIPIEARINLILYMFPSFVVFSIFRLLMTFRFGLDAFSLINYAKEQVIKLNLNLPEESRKEKDNIQFFRAYYLTIYYAYKRIKKFALFNFGQDASTILKVNRFPLLSSQILFLNDYKKKILLAFLTELEKRELVYESKKFAKLMNKIEDEYKDTIPNYNSQFDFDTLFHRVTYLDYLKIVITFLLPIITTIANLYFNMMI